MAENNFQKIWKDPVWSNVISVIIITLSTLIYNLITSKLENVDFKSVFIGFWNVQIKLWAISIIFLFCLILSTIINYRKRKKVVSFEYDDKTLALDIELFNRIRNELLPQEGTIYWLRHNNFAGFSFDVEKLEPLDDIEYENKKSDFEFLNPELEKIRLELLQEISTFTTLMAENTYPNQNGRQSVPADLETEDHVMFWEIVNEIHANKHRLCDKYDELIRMGRKILKV